MDTKKLWRLQAMKKNRQNLCSLLHKKEFHFADYLKQMLFTTLGLFLVAGVLFAFLGFNSGFAFSGGYEINVKFHTEISSEQRSDYSTMIEDVLVDHDINNYELTQIGDSSDSAILVQVKTKLDEETILETLEAVSDQVQAKIDATGEISYLEISNPQGFEANYTVSQTWLSVLAVAIVFVAIGAYVAIRYDWASAVGVSVANLNNVLLYLSLITILRVPTSQSLFLGLLLVQILTSAYAIYQFAFIKEGFAKETLTKMSNKQVTNKAVKSLLKTNIMIAGVLFVIGVAVMGIGQGLAVELGAILLLSGILAGYASVFVTIWIWSMLFNREQDKRYLARLAKKADPKKVEEEKIVV